jgi:hypothetical protein
MQLGGKIDFAPADWLYSESLTKSTKSAELSKTFRSQDFEVAFAWSLESIGPVILFKSQIYIKHN